MTAFLSDRINLLPQSATLAMNKQSQLLKAQGYDICDLSIGEPNFPTPSYIQQAAKEAIDSGSYFSYSPVAGYQDLRVAITKKLAKENNITCTPEQIVVSTGAKQSLSNLFLCLLNPGDEVIVYTPYWVSYASIIQLAGGKPIFIKGNKENNYEPTNDQLEQAITPKTKAIIFSSPSNPTGSVLSKSSLMAIAAVLEKHKHVLVVADEIYEHINFTDDFISIGSIASIQDRVITVNGFSKSYAMTGWRIGYLAAPLWLAKACEKIQGQLTSGPCSISQRAALAAFDVDMQIIAEMRTIYKRRRDLAMKGISSITGITCNIPLGAFYLFPDISYYFGYTDGEQVIKTAEDFCMYILKEAKVTLVDGGAFGEPNCIRLSYATSDEVIQEAMERMQKALQKLYPTR
jgi:aspartate aminotransferase